MTLFYQELRYADVNWIIITYCECVFVALVIQHAKHMQHIIFLSVACLVVPYFSTLSHKRHELQEKSY